MKPFELTIWPARPDRKRLFTLLFGLYFMLSVFAVIFHSHNIGDQHAVHDTCGFCQVAQAGGLSAGTAQAAISVAITILAIYSLIAFLPASRPILAQALISHGNRAPPTL